MSCAAGIPHVLDKPKLSERLDLPTLLLLKAQKTRHCIPQVLDEEHSDALFCNLSVRSFNLMINVYHNKVILQEGIIGLWQVNRIYTTLLKSGLLGECLSLCHDAK